MEHELHHQTATFEKINATLDRITEQQEKAALEMKEIREQMKDTDRRLKHWGGISHSGRKQDTDQNPWATAPQEKDY